MTVSLVGESHSSNFNAERAQLKANSFFASSFPSPAMSQESRELAVRSVQQQTLNFPDGRVYVGEVEDELPHGIGKMTYPDKSFEAGSFDKGKFWNGMWYRIKIAHDSQNGSFCKIQ
jgi:hypothetical protein